MIIFKVIYILISITFLSKAYSKGGVEKLNYACLKLTQWTYKEDSVDISDKGLLYGASGKYRFSQNGLEKIGLKFSFLLGKTTYDGFVVNISTNQKTPISFKNSNLIYSLRGDYYVYENSHFSLALGFDYRMLINFDEPDLSFDYKRTQMYMTIPLTFEFQTPIGNNNLVLDFSILPLLVGRNESFIFGKNEEPLSFQQKMGKGVGLSLGAHFFVDKFLFGIEGNYWNIGSSKKVQFLTTQGLRIGFEPANTTLSFSFKIGMKI